MDTPSSQPTAGKEPGSLQVRTRSALILAPLFLAVLYLGGYTFALVMAVLGGIAAFEWSRMVAAKKPVVGLHHMVGILTGFAAIIGGLSGYPVVSVAMTLGGGFLVFAYTISRDGEHWGQNIIGMLYIGFAVADMIWLRTGLMFGLYHMLTLLFIVWASDTFAYFSGRTIGGPKLAPSISPKKTWAGFLGGSFGAGLVAAGLACPFVLEQTGVQTLGGLGMIGYAVMGFFLSMAGQVGDLLISIIKRHYSVKDTGNLIPGHGGILDRIDALLLVSLVFGCIAVVLR